MDPLAQRVQRGDPGAFDELHRAYSGRIHRFIERMVGPRDAEDLTQEVFLRVIKGLRRYREAERFEAWIFTIVNNLCLDAYRRRKPVAEAPELPAPRRFEPDRSAERRERLEALLAELRCLPFEQRQVFLLREEAGLSFKEVSETLNAPLGTVLARMKYAMDRLRSRLSREVNRAV